MTKKIDKSVSITKQYNALYTKNYFSEAILSLSIILID